MNFKQATDALLVSVTLEDLAEAMGVSVQSLRQARTSENSTAHRSAPNGWEAAVVRVAERKISHYRRLIERLSNERK
jgi:hypothetical protein